MKAVPAGQGTAYSLHKGQNIDMTTGEFRGEFKPDRRARSSGEMNVHALSSSGCSARSATSLPCHDMGDDVLASTPSFQADLELPESCDVHASEIQNSPEPVHVREITLRDSVGISLGVPMKVEDKEVFGIIDSAAQITVMNSKVAASLRSSLLSKPELVRIKNAQSGSIMDGQWIKSVEFSIGQGTYIWDVVVADITDELLLGLDFLKAHSAKLDLECNTITLQGEVLHAVLKKDPAGNSFHVNCASVARRTVIPPNSVAIVTAKLPSASPHDFVLQPNRDLALLPAYVVVSGREGSVPVCLVNDSGQYVTLRAGEFLGSLEEIDMVLDDDISDTDSVPADGVHIRRVKTANTDGSSAVPAEDTHEHIDQDDRPRRVSAVPEHLEKLFADSSAKLTPEQANILAEVLRDYGDVFARHDLDLGEFSAIQHRIRTVDDHPIKLRMRRTPLGFEKEEEKHLRAMLEAGVIEESTSDWCAAPVLIRKKDGSVRYCLDYRQLNSKTVKDVFPLPLVEECLDTLSGSEFYSTVDMAAGYWQISVHPEDRHKSAFVTKYGLFQHVRMPFGLCNAPATFSRAMGLVLRGLTWKYVLAYLDDIVVLGNSFEDHIHNLRTVLQRFRQHGLKLKPKKCSLCQREIQFLGHRIDQNGVHITKAKTESVLDWPTPRNRTEMESFLGFVNYHRNFIRGFADLAAPLYRLTGPKSVYQWTDECEQAFRALKDAVVSAPVLAFPNAHDPFILDTDASDLCLGAELSQVQDGVERPISYGSVVLPPERRRYCTTRKELLAVVLFTRQFRHYLLGRKFIVRTDHHSLIWLMQFKHPEGQLARWLEELSQFDMVIEHRPGSKHTNADGLSRIPVPESACIQGRITPDSLPCGGCTYCERAYQRWSTFEEEVDDTIPLAVRTITLDKDSVTQTVPADELLDELLDDFPLFQSTPDEKHETEDEEVTEEFVCFDQPNWLMAYSPEELRQHQLKDANLLPIISWLETKLTPSIRELSLTSPATRHIWLCKSQLELKNGVLFYQWISETHQKLKLVVPDSLQSEVLRLVHDSKVGGHFGEDKTFLRLKSSFYWYGASVDVTTYVKSCAACSKNKKPSVRAKAALGSYVAGGRNERVHIDLLGPFPKSKSGNRYILVIVDQFTKWFECVAIPDQSAEVVAKAFVNQYISRSGPPLEIHSDQGGCFTASLFEACCKLLEVTKTRTTPYRPQSNGQVERYNRVLLPMIRCYLRNGQTNWDENLQLLAMAIRATVNRSTGFTANMMMLGEEVRTPADVLLGVSAANWSPKEPAEYVRWLRSVLADVHRVARHMLQASQHRQKKTYDLKLAQRTYQTGDLVWILDESTKVGRSSKLHPPWKGPALVAEVLSPVLYVVEDRKGRHVLHHDKLKLCRDRSIPFWLRKKRHLLLQSDDTLPYSQDESISPTPGEDPGTGTTEVATDEPPASSSDQEQTLLYEDLSVDLDETIPYSDSFVDFSQEVIDDLSSYHLDELFTEPCTTRAGRISRPPSYLADYDA